MMSAIKEAVGNLFSSPITLYQNMTSNACIFWAVSFAGELSTTICPSVSPIHRSSNNCACVLTPQIVFSDIGPAGHEVLHYHLRRISFLSHRSDVIAINRRICELRRKLAGVALRCSWGRRYWAFVVTLKSSAFSRP